MLERVDTHALVNLLATVNMPDQEWQTIRSQILGDILQVSEGIDNPDSDSAWRVLLISESFLCIYDWKQTYTIL